MKTFHAPSGVTLHGYPARASLVGGLLPRGRISTLRAPADLAVAVVAEIVSGVAAPAVACGLVSKPGEPRRPLAGVLRAPMLAAAEAAALVTPGVAADAMAAVTASAFARGVGRPIPAAVVRAHPSVADDLAIFGRIRAAQEHAGSDVGLIVLIAEFDDQLYEQARRLVSAFPAAAVLVAGTGEADIGAEYLGARLVADKDSITVEPAEGSTVAPFICRWFPRSTVLIDGEEVLVMTPGPRRAWVPPVRKQPEPEIAAAPEPIAERGAFVYVLPIANTRDLSPDERDLLGESAWSNDRLAALRTAASIPGRVIIAVAHAPDRDPRGDSAESLIGWLRSEVRHQGLDDRISVERAPFGIQFNAPVAQAA